MVAPVLARSPITKVHFVQYSGTIVQLCPKIPRCTLYTRINVGTLALYNSTTYSPITKVHFVQYSGTIVQ